MRESRFKVGDRVVVVEAFADTHESAVGAVGTVVRVVRWDYGKPGKDWLNEIEFDEPANTRGDYTTTRWNIFDPALQKFEGGSDAEAF